jgi:hypothetical protein
MAFTSSSCTLYKGTCTETTTTGTDRVYTRHRACYWTTPTTIFTDYDCKNSAGDSLIVAATIASSTV